MFRKRLKQVGAWVLALSMVLGSAQLPAMGVQAASDDTAVTAEVTPREGESTGTEAERIAATLTAPVIDANTTQITMPTVPEGVTVRLCADYEQIIGADGKVYKPLVQKAVKAFYKVDDGTNTADSAEFNLTVPGKYTDSANAKPAVIPELQEWHGTTGNFTITDASRIVIAGDQLTKTAEFFADDYKAVTGKDISVVKGSASDVKAGDFFLTLGSTDEGLGKEGYVMTIEDSVKIEASETTGAYWGTISALQILKQTGNTIPKGVTRDYPKYEVRGFMLDVGRKTFDFNTVKEFAKNMSWYKMNNFQIHLSDNLIFHEDYPTIEEAIADSYAGFRLESGLKPTNEKMETLHSQDTYYTKDEFRSFIKDSRDMGLNIVPEFDMPAHALGITRAFPEYMTNKTGGAHRYLIEELNITDPEATTLAQNIWNDYFTGDDPVFDKDTIIHIGTDEFHGEDGQPGKESFRRFSADMIKFVQDTGRTVRMWGSLSNKSGTTPVPSKDVQLNIWNTGYANPAVMHSLGYDMINTLEGSLYIVPSAGYYSNYLNAQGLYSSWTPNNFAGTVLKAGDEQVLGGCYAIWNDQIDTRINGITEYDDFDRFFQPLPSLSAKMWGDGQDKTFAEMREVAEKVSTAPNTNPYHKVASKTETIMDYSFNDSKMKDASGNKYDIKAQKNVTLEDGKAGKALKLAGGESYVETPVDMVGPVNSISMWVKRDSASGNEEQILCETTRKFDSYAIKAVQKGTGKVGYSREKADFSFDYTLPKDKWVYLTINGYKDKAELYVNNEFVSSAVMDTPTRTTGSVVATLSLPVARIGSTTNSFKGMIDELTIGTTPAASKDYTKLSQAGWTADACTAHSGEGPAANAIDGNPDTYWHTNWATPDVITEEHDHWFSVTLPEAKTINKLSYLPRQDSRNGRVLGYDIEVTKPDGTKVTVVTGGEWADTADVKYAEFDPIEAKSVKLIITDAANTNNAKHGTMAELNLYAAITKAESETLFNQYKDLSGSSSEYTTRSWALFEEALANMEAVLANPESTSADYASAYTRLRNSAENLAKKPPVNKTDLNKAVEDAGKKDLSAFTAESVKAFTAALEDAKAVLGDLDATQEEVDEALKALKAAEANLEKEPAPGPGPNPNPGPNPGPNPIPGPEDPVVIPAKGTTIPVKGITYKVTKSDAKNGTVSVFKADKKLGKAVIPSSVKIGGYTFKVTSVDAKAFSGCKKITSVTIGANVTSIGSKAFENCKKLKKVTFKSTKAPKIASKAFSGTYAKCKVTAPKKMTKKEFNLLKTRLKKAKISKKAIIKK